MPSTELSFLNRSLPITKPRALFVFSDVFFEAMETIVSQIAGDRRRHGGLVQAAGVEPAQTSRSEGSIC